MAKVWRRYPDQSRRRNEEDRVGHMGAPFVLYTSFFGRMELRSTSTLAPSENSSAGRLRDLPIEV